MAKDGHEPADDPRMSAVYRKADQGQQEVATRQMRLLPRLRSALILVDGKKTTSDLQTVLGAGCTETLKRLEDLGLIAAQQRSSRSGHGGPATVSPGPVTLSPSGPATQAPVTLSPPVTQSPPSTQGPVSVPPPLAAASAALAPAPAPVAAPVPASAPVAAARPLIPPLPTPVLIDEVMEEDLLPLNVDEPLQGPEFDLVRERAVQCLSQRMGIDADQLCADINNAVTDDE